MDLLKKAVVIRQTWFFFNNIGRLDTPERLNSDLTRRCDATHRRLFIGAAYCTVQLQAVSKIKFILRCKIYSF